MKSMLQKILGACGYQVLPKSHDPVLQELALTYRQLRVSSSASERQHQLAKLASLGHLRDLLKTHQIQTVVDVGANVGQFGLSLRKVGFSGKILSFEPMRQARSRLEAVAATLPPWQVFSTALGSRPEQKNLQIFKDNTFSSLHAVTPSGKNIFGPYVQTQGEELVKVETLDQLIGTSLKSEIQGPVMLKTDTQGHDLEVLQGGVRLLSQTSVVLTEAAAEVIYEGAPPFTEILEFLKGCGFAASGFYPFSHRQETLAMVEFDAFFVRKKTDA